MPNIRTSSPRWPRAIGILAGVLIALSAGAHSFLGWPAIAGQLSATNTPADLVRGLRVAWQFGGVAMLAFAALVLMTFAPADGPRSTRSAMLIGVLYVAFGVWALASTRDPFFFIFIVPGVLLVTASLASARV
jgi:hypothetical protein